MARPGVRLGPGSACLQRGPFVLAKSVCLCLQEGECACVCVCVCGVWGRPGKVARLSLRDQDDRRSLI